MSDVLAVTGGQCLPEKAPDEPPTRPDPNVPEFQYLSKKYSLSYVEVVQLYTAFQAVDLDGSGGLDTREFMDILACVFLYAFYCFYVYFLCSTIPPRRATKA
jgi:hypothetical protein